MPLASVSQNQWPVLQLLLLILQLQQLRLLLLLLPQQLVHQCRRLHHQLYLLLLLLGLLPLLQAASGQPTAALATAAALDLAAAYVPPCAMVDAIA